MEKESFYFYNYLIKEHNIDKEYLDLIKFEIDKRIYYYGNNFKINYDKSNSVKFYVFLIIKIFYLLINKISKRNKRRPVIISNVYFNFNNELKEIGYEVLFPELNIRNRINFIGNLTILLKYEFIKRRLRTDYLDNILSYKFQKKVMNFKAELKEYFLNHDVKALFIAYDMPFFEKILISIFKEINKPSFVFLHGLPSRYNDIDDNRADYLVVWGEKIKENYSKAGVDEKKIIVTGHPANFKILNNSLKNSLENVLVLTNSISPYPENSNAIILQDRGNTLFYLYSIQIVLQKFGVRNVRLRPHPFEKHNWYKRNIDNSFFMIEEESLSTSLDKSTVVIGPSSTVLLEALTHNINYIVYEPIVNNLTIKNFKLVPPFDKSDLRLVVATDEEELYNNIKNKRMTERSIIKDYLGDRFNISKLTCFIR